MNPDLQRAVDRWAGQPLCLLFTIWERLCGLLSPPVPPDGPPRRIMFIELAEIGGLVVAYPALMHARRLFPQAELYFCTFAGGKGILDLLDVVPPERQFIIRPDSPATLATDTLRAIGAMHRAGIDAVVNLETFARFSSLLALLSGAPRRAGFFRFRDEGRYTGDLLTHKVIYNPHVHAARSFITLVQALAEQPGRQPRAKLPLGDASLDLPRIGLDQGARREMTAMLEAEAGGPLGHARMVILNPNASDLVAARRWPAEHFLELGRGLLAGDNLRIVLTGTGSERPHCQRLADALDAPGRVLNLAGRTSLRQLIDLYNLCHLLITNDSGPAHFASLTGLPVLALFGPETPDIYGPLGENAHVIYRALACSPCVSAYNQKRTPCRDNICLTGISPAEALRRAKEILDRKGKE